MDNHVRLSVYLSVRLSNPFVSRAVSLLQGSGRACFYSYEQRSAAAHTAGRHSAKQAEPSSAASWSLRATRQSLPTYDGDCDANCDVNCDCDFSKKRDRLPAVQVAARAQNRLYSAG